MKRRRRRCWSAALALVVIAAAGSTMVEPAAADDAQLEISGEVVDLYPGIDAVMPVVVTNHEAFGVEVSLTDVDVTDASVACPGSMLSFGDAPSATIAAGATAT